MSKFLLGVQSNLGLERRKEGNKRKHKKKLSLQTCLNNSVES